MQSSILKTFNKALKIFAVLYQHIIIYNLGFIFHLHFTDQNKKIFLPWKRVHFDMDTLCIHVPTVTVFPHKMQWGVELPSKGWTDRAHMGISVSTANTPPKTDKVVQVLCHGCSEFTGFPIGFLLKGLSSRVWDSCMSGPGHFCLSNADYLGAIRHLKGLCPSGLRQLTLIPSPSTFIGLST